MSNLKICVLTGTRAEYGLLRNILFKMKADEEIDLKLLVTGTHLSDGFGNTQKEIIEDGFEFDKVKIPVEDDSKIGMAGNTGEAIALFSQYFAKINPQMLVILGDRYEAFAAAVAAYILSIPIAHISGGDITEGALDDGFRHCITKLSSIHFPGCKDSARRIIQMGESPEYVFSVGDPGVENCLNTNFLSTKELESNLNFPLNEKRYGVVTFHPVTQEESTATGQLFQLINALDKHMDMQFIITTANADAGGRAINNMWETYAKTHRNWLVVPSLGVVRYLSAVKHSAVVIGNSSSGVVEAPALGVPTVNIGDRQSGRMLADSVIDCNPICEEIDKAISMALDEKFQKLASTCESPFGKGNTSSDIVRTIKMCLLNRRISSKKKFHDIKIEE